MPINMNPLSNRYLGLCLGITIGVILTGAMIKVHYQNSGDDLKADRKSTPESAGQSYSLRSQIAGIEIVESNFRQLSLNFKPKDQPELKQAPVKQQVIGEIDSVLRNNGDKPVLALHFDCGFQNNSRSHKTVIFYSDPLMPGLQRVHKMKIASEQPSVSISAAVFQDGSYEGDYARANDLILQLIGARERNAAESGKLLEIAKSPDYAMHNSLLAYRQGIIEELNGSGRDKPEIHNIRSLDDEVLAKKRAGHKDVLIAYRMLSDDLLRKLEKNDYAGAKNHISRMAQYMNSRYGQFGGVAQ
ncbi:MAG: hypothetical protein AB7H86_05100 [Blastocatellales bacterium]